MKKFTLLFGLIFLFLCAKSQKYNITGEWSHPAGNTLQIFQDGKRIDYVYVNPYYAHYGNLTYTSETKLEGIAKRVNRENGCVTYLYIIWVVEADNTIRESCRGVDNNCDLTTEYFSDNHILMKKL